MLEFPDNIGELVGEGSIVVSVQTKGGGRVRFQENRLELYPLDLKMKDAEDFCVSRGGHLASIGSQEDLDEIAEVAGGEFVWLGGTRVRDDWHWVDGRPWGYESWDPESYIGKMPNLAKLDWDCILFIPIGSVWWNNKCAKEEGIKFICLESVNTTFMESRNKSLTLNKSLFMYRSKFVFFEI